MEPERGTVADARCGICAMIERIAADSLPDAIAELPRSWLILGDAQFYRGYCVILAKRHAREMHALPRGEAHELLDELMAVAKAVEHVTKPLKLNYECLGNQEPHVHWHVFPRYADDRMRLEPVWTRPIDERKRSLPERDRLELIAAIQAEIRTLMPAARLI